jgi:hypothetical protein
MVEVVRINVTYRKMDAAGRRRQREEKRNYLELQRRAKEQAKQSALEQASLEVETYKNQMDVLLSLHKEHCDDLDWEALAALLPPPCPLKNSHHEFIAKQQLLLVPPNQRQQSQTMVEQARLLDEQAFQEAMQTYANTRAEREKLKNLSCRIIAGEKKAYIEALDEFDPFTEVSEIGSSIQFRAHSAKLLECLLKANGVQAIPADVKTLTAAGKVSTKPMAKARLCEVYQDYLCGCVLRVAREVFALLPVDTLLVTAFVDSIDTQTGQTMEQPVLSVVMPRKLVAKLNFERIDPSDSMEQFQHRGDLKVTRKSLSFETIVPLTPADIELDPFENNGTHDFFVAVRRLREEFRTEIDKMSPNKQLNKDDQS